MLQWIPGADIRPPIERRIRIMKSIAAAIFLATAIGSTPVLAADDPPDLAARTARANGVGSVVGAVLGGLVGGPPGAIAGLALGGIASDWQQQSKLALELEQRGDALAIERAELIADQQRSKVQLAALSRTLEAERGAAARTADAALLAHGLEFAVAFRTSSAELPEDVDAGLEALAQLILALPALEVHLDGYADPRGSGEFNQELSLARAEAVRDRLVAAGVEPGRIHLTAYGASGSLAAGDVADPDGWALQRRVSVRVEVREGQLAAMP
jgi:outer membrane protein OmpA-like peptidoglycan-associated protein